LYIIAAEIVAQFEEIKDMMDCIKAFFRKVHVSSGRLPSSPGLWLGVCTTQ